jgi:hypothetical protein
MVHAILFALFGALLVYGVLPGALVGYHVGWWRGHGARGIIAGALGGGVGAIGGAVLYSVYLRSLPFEIRRDEWGPYRHILHEPPLHVQISIIIASSVTVALLLALVVSWRRPAQQTPPRRVSSLLGTSLLLVGSNIVAFAVRNLIIASISRSGDMGMITSVVVYIGLLAVVAGAVTLTIPAILTRPSRQPRQ